MKKAIRLSVILIVISQLMPLAQIETENPEPKKALFTSCGTIATNGSSLWHLEVKLFLRGFVEKSRK